jgi:glycosyltransferase involved in cell wall biosynthesis
MSTDTAASPALDDIKRSLPQAADAAQCLALAGAADAAGDRELNRACLERAVALDRDCQPALLNLAALALDDDDTASTFAFLEEASRIVPLPADIESLRARLRTAAENVPELSHYLQAIGHSPAQKAEPVRSILMITATFPESVSDDAVRHVSDLVDGLGRRGHRVKVLTSGTGSETPTLAVENAAAAALVLRTLRLADGERSREHLVRDNVARVRTALKKSAADLVLAVNFDGFDPALLRAALESGVPVLHCIATAKPAFAADELPRDAHYWIAPASDWAGTALRNAGYETTRMDTVYPAVSTSRAFRLFLPDLRRLRICCTSEFQAGRGVDTLLAALAQLHAGGVEFTAELAGRMVDEAFLARQREFVEARGLGAKVVFTPAADAAGTRDLLARHNVLVGPSRLPEPFNRVHVEALAAGLVVVSSGAGGTKEIVRDGTDGLVFNPSDAGDLVAKLNALMADSELAARLQRAGQRRAQSFSVEKAVRKIESLAAELQSVMATDTIAAG